MSALKRSLSVLGPALAMFAAAWLIVASCTGGSGARERALVLAVRDDGGDSLAEVAIEVAGRVRGTTDAHGGLRLIARPGTMVAARCPEAYRPAQAQRVAEDSANSMTFVCRPRLRTIAVVVSAPAARGLMLRAGAQSLGRVDEQGILHAVLKRAPGSKLALSLSARGEREEVFATRELEVDDHDRIVLFEPQRP